jgi:hypothetical protein
MALRTIYYLPLTIYRFYETNQRSKTTRKINAHIPVDEFLSSAIRRNCRAGFEVSIDNLVSIATGEAENSTPFASVRSAALLAQISMGKQPQHVHVENYAWLETIVQLALKHFKDPDAYNAWITEVVASLENHQ